MAIDSTSAALWDWDISNNTVYYSPSWKMLLGYREDEVQFDLSEWSSRIHPDDKEKH